MKKHSFMLSMVGLAVVGDQFKSTIREHHDAGRRLYEAIEACCRANTDEVNIVIHISNDVTAFVKVHEDANVQELCEGLIKIATDVSVESISSRNDILYHIAAQFSVSRLTLPVDFKIHPFQTKLPPITAYEEEMGQVFKKSAHATEKFYDKFYKAHKGHDRHKNKRK